MQNIGRQKMFTSDHAVIKVLKKNLKATQKVDYKQDIHMPPF